MENKYVENEFSDQPVSFQVQDNKLYGVLSVPVKKFHVAVIIVVGGPQFRVGSHRQFTLLARQLARQGVLALRFDYTGMGYSEGLPKKFYEVDQDIAAAVNFVASNHDHVEKIFVWGLCDAASAIAFTAYTHERINGMIILNPWVRSEASHSKAILSSYYRDRIFSVDVWKDLLKSPGKIIDAIISLLTVCWKVLINIFDSNKVAHEIEISVAERENNLTASVLKGMTNFKGNICLILSENDLTADEFKREFEESDWMQDQSNNQKTIVHYVNEADHTFSSALWRSKVEEITINFVNA